MKINSKKKSLLLAIYMLINLSLTGCGNEYSSDVKINEDSSKTEYEICNIDESTKQIDSDVNFINVVYLSHDDESDESIELIDEYTYSVKINNKIYYVGLDTDKNIHFIYLKGIRYDSNSKVYDTYITAPSGYYYDYSHICKRLPSNCEKSFILVSNEEAQLVENLLSFYNENNYCPIR